MVKSQSRKNIILLSILIVLVVLCAWLYRYNPYERKSTTFDKDLFAIENVNQAVSRIELKGQGFSNILEKQGDYWTVNDLYRMDASMQQVFFKLLQQISIQRPVTGEKLTDIKQNVLDSGVHVMIYRDDQIINSFMVGGDFEAMRSFFVKGDQVYLMQLPGYQSYVSGIFEVSEDDWRDRVIFHGTWQDIVNIEIFRPEKVSAKFNYADGLLHMQNKQADTVEVMNFIERFNYLFVDQFLPENHIALRKRQSFEKAGGIQIEALDESKSLKLNFFRNPSFNAYLVLINDQQWAAIRNERVEKLWLELDKL